MAYNNPDPYEDGAPAAEPSAESEGDHKEDDGEQTALLPKSFFQGKELEIGSRCEVEISQIHDEEVSVKYVPHEESKEEAPKEPAMSPGGGESPPEYN